MSWLEGLIEGLFDGGGKQGQGERSSSAKRSRRKDDRGSGGYSAGKLGELAREKEQEQKKRTRRRGRD